MIPLVVSTSVDIAKTTFCWSYIFLAIIVPLSLSVVATGNTMLIYANAPCGLFEMNRNTIFNEVHVYKFMILQRCTCSVTVSFFFNLLLLDVQLTSRPNDFPWKRQDISRPADDFVSLSMDGASVPAKTCGLRHI